jgi:enamine deaminase RidA (YjgF/YER057c/UK114 family)
MEASSGSTSTAGGTIDNPDIRRLGVTRRWSDAVIHNGGVVYLVEVPDDSTTDPRDQFRQVFNQVVARLAMAGSDLTRLLHVTIYLPYLPDDLAEFNALWDEWIPEGHAPSRACIHAALAAPDYRVELVVTAAVATATATKSSN